VLQAEASLLEGRRVGVHAVSSWRCLWVGGRLVLALGSVLCRRRLDRKIRVSCCRSVECGVPRWCGLPRGCGAPPLGPKPPRPGVELASCGFMFPSSAALVLLCKALPWVAGGTMGPKNGARQPATSLVFHWCGTNRLAICMLCGLLRRLIWRGRRRQLPRSRAPLALAAAYAARKAAPRARRAASQTQHRRAAKRIKS
jgi:hypothetical protein